MIADSSPSRPGGADFHASLQSALAPLYAEPFADETRKVRDRLLITSFTLLLLALGVIQPDKKAKVPVLDLDITIVSGLRWILVALCAYFLVVHSARVYAEWRAFAMQREFADAELTRTASSLFDRSRATQSEADQDMAGLKRDIELMAALQKEPPEIAELRKRDDALDAEQQGLFAELRANESSMSTRQQEDALFQINRLTDARMELVERMEEVRQQHRLANASIREELQARASPTAVRDFEERARFQADKFRQVQRDFDAMRIGVRHALRIKTLRLLIDIAFPTLFSLGAISAACLMQS